MTAIVTRAQAKARGLARYFEGAECRAGHVAERYTCSRKCVECQRSHSDAYKMKNQDAMIEYGRLRRQETAQYQRERAKRWKKANPGKVVAQKSLRRARKVAAIPADFSDFDQFVIQEAAEACKRREALHGEPFEIDHLVPLSRGGLHCATNVQVIPARLNRWKNNKLVLTRPGEWIARA